MRGAWLAIPLLVSALLSGCGGKGGGGEDELVINSLVTQDVTANSTRDDSLEIPKAGTTGHIVGFVVDQAIRPIEGALVRLPGMDFEEVTDRDGGFSFGNLHAGPYYLTAAAAGFYNASAVVDVGNDAVVRVKVVLTRIPPPEPYHVTQEFEGFADFTGQSLFGSLGGCTYCRFQASFDANPAAIVIEAIMDPYAGIDTTGASQNSFYYSLQPAGECCGEGTYGERPNPMNVVLTSDLLPVDVTSWDLEVSPHGFPVPETSKSFEVFVTAFYNAPPPEGWSALAPPA